MARGDKTKELAFPMWKDGHALASIQRALCKGTTTKPGSIRGWVVDWERGKQGTCKPKVKK